MNNHTVFKRLYRFTFGILAWVAVVWYFLKFTVFREPGTSFASGMFSYFSYFTIQSNLLVAVWWAAALLNRDNKFTRWLLQPKIKGAFTAYITATFLGFAVLLSHTYSPGGVDLFLSNTTHYVVPLAFILDWFLFEERGVYQWRFTLDWLVYPVGYFIFAMIHGTFTGDFLYPFFDPNILGWGGMAIQVTFILVTFILLESVYIGINRRLRSSLTKRNGGTHAAN